MGKKRRNDESAESDTPRKKETIPEFNGTVFKAMLKDPTTAMKGLEKFISTAKKLPRSDLYDVVEGYIKISMECAEIFKLLEGEKHVESEMMLIFGSLEAILLRTASDLSHFNMVGNAIVKKTVFSYMKVLQGSFRSANHRFIRQCLCLLCALVTQGPEAAREVLSHLHINKFLSGLAKMKDKQGRPDVRQAFIQFVLSFVVSGDNVTVGQILEIKVILNTGLKEDRMSTVNLILSTLKTKVVLNKAISKTQKVRFFTPAVLASIASLYKWNGIADATVDDDRLSGMTVIRELAHSFLLDLCCSRKHGISFHDVSFGTAGRPGNIVLLQFLVGLKQATEDELVADLVVNVLKATPDILSRYFKETQYAYAPRLKTTWQDNVKLLKKIYEAQPEISTVFQTQEVIPLPRLLSMVMVISLPPVCNKSFFTQGLIVTHLTTLSVVNFILKRASKNIEYLLDKSVWCSSDLYTAEMMGDLVQQYREMLGKILPDMTSIIEKWQSLSKKEKAGSEEKKDKSEGDAKLTKCKVPGSTEVILLKALILQVICLYQKVVPHLVSQCKFDFSKLLKGIVSEKGIKDEVPPVLQHHVLQLALDLPASKFSWFHKDSSSGEKSVFYLLLKMFVSSSSSHLKASTQMLVLKVLKDTGVFEHTWTELELWLEQLARLEPNQQETVIQFLERVLVKLVCSSYEYTDKVASLVQEAGYLQANLSSQEGDTASVPVSHIDDVIDMLDIIMEASDGELEEFGPAVSEDLIMQTFPFSALVPAALEARNKLPADSGMVYEYLAAVLSDVLHCQREPLPLCLALLQYDKEFVSSECFTSPHSAIVCFHQYYSKWLPQQYQTSYTALMKAAYIQGPDTLLKDTFRKSAEEALASLSLAEFPVAIKQILLYIRSTVENFGLFSKDVGASVLRTFMEILEKMVIKLQGFQEAKNSELAILLSALGSVFKHPYLEQWFLALELSAMPPHSLNPVRLKHLCSLMTDNILVLLKLCAPVLQELNHLELLRSYMGALERAALQELVEKGSKPAKKHSRTFQGLLSLHNYMDSGNLREVVSKLLLLPHNSLISPSSSKGANFELSIYGQAALQILTECKYTASQDHGTFLTQAHLFGLGTLLLSCSKPALEAFLLQFLSSEPSSAKLLHTDVLLHCLQRPLSDSLAISSLLLQNCSTHRLRFEMWCLEPENMEKLSDQSEAFLPLINMYLHVASREDPARPKDVLLAKFSQCVLGNLTEESGAQLTETLGSLIKLSANSKDIRDLINSLPSALQNVDNVISDKLADCPEEQEKWRKSVATAAIKCLIASYSHSKDQATSPLEQEHSILKRLQRISKEDITASEWNNFVKNGLKYRYRDHHFLNTLSSLLEVLYCGTEVQKDLIPLPTLYTMISSHSLFLPTMLDSEEANSCQIKEELVFLLLCLVKKSPSVCNINHFVVLLGAYGATLSTSDQKLLLLLQEYERNQVSLLKFQSLLWGPTAVERHKTSKSLGASLWKQTSSDDLLALLKPDKMLQTIAHFPQQRKIIPQESTEPLYNNNKVKDLGNLYDPCFLLPLFSAILRPECVIDCLKFVSSHALGVTVMALSSYDPKVRAAAYHVLSCFYQHLEGAQFREKRQLLYLMDMVKNGIQQQNQRLPFVMTTYITKVAQQMLKPEDHMYVVLNRFLLSHQSLDFRRVPEFFKLFYSFDLEHKVEREWILSVLEQGMKDGHCYDLCNQQGIFQILLGFSSSPLCDEHFQVHACLSVAAHVTKAAHNLTKTSGLLTWIMQIVEKRNLDWQLLCAIIDLFHVLWFTALGQKEKQVDEAKTSLSAEEKPQSFVKCLPPPLISEFLCVASTITRHLGLGLKAAQLSLFLQTLCSVLKHRAAALHVSKQADRLTLQPQPLSCTEALALLHCWASSKDKARVKSSLSHVYVRKEKLAEDTETENEDKSLLTECKLYLTNIFVHWEPAFQLSELQPALPTDKLDPSWLARITAHLVTKWSLRCLVEDAYDENRAKEFLLWLEKAVIKHTKIVDVVLLDLGLKADLLRLYHQAFEAHCHSSISARAETLQLFTKIMISLLEIQGNLPELHQAVVSAFRCLVFLFPEAGLSLLSLYIHEVWSGATSADLFLSHVSLVTGAKCKKVKSSQKKVDIRAICNDIITMKS
uniref:URB1 ribosome biogenesis homolog n=1 Tax=Pundamilia nyererei TaxID=303518 RepID=A0A3B4FUG2_9CICH